MVIRALLLLAFLYAIPRAQGDRFFQPTPGFIRAQDLPDSFTVKVRSIQLATKDAFEGSTAHSEAEQYVFDIGNSLHMESRPGTIRRRLLFRAGDTVTKGLLLETEKALRQEEFLSDAIIEVMPWNDGTAHVKVTTFDQWTTVPGVSLQRLGKEWIYWIGPVESNLFGTGQRLGFFLGHDQVRDTRWLDYANNALFPARLRFSTHAAWLSDGYSVQASLSKPLESRTSRWSFASSFSADKVSEWVYFDANRLSALPDSLARDFSGDFSLRAKFPHVVTQTANASVTRSFGYHTKFSVTPTLDWEDRYNVSGTKAYVTPERYLPLEPSARHPNERNDYLTGLSLSVYQYDYKTVQNYNNLKWSETLETGWRLSTKLAKNQSWLGAKNDDWYLSHTAVYNNAWWDDLFLSSSASMRYFVSPAGFDDGYATGFGEVQWKPVNLTSSFLSVTWNHFFAAEKSQQLLLGEDNGLNGYPNLYYAGQARILIEAEQRLFPSFEIGTVVPAFAVFANAGNTFPGYADFDWDELHYSAGIGLRLGATKSTQKLVNHLNLSWPIGDKYLSSPWPVFSIRAKKSL
jgi:hypothetical protein